MLPLRISIVQKSGRLGPSVHLFEHVVQFLHIQIETKAPNQQRNFGLVLRKALDKKANYNCCQSSHRRLGAAAVINHNVPNEIVQPSNYDNSHWTQGDDYRMAFLAGATLDFGLNLKADDQNAGAVCRLMCFILSALGEKLCVQHILHPQRHEPLPAEAERGTSCGEGTVTETTVKSHARWA